MNSFCGSTASEWDHLRPLVLDKKPTGYVSEIHNLVPACGKCNQSKGNKPWVSWIISTAKLSPRTRGVKDLEQRIKNALLF
ncbi:MAG: HNH endonuclease [Gammaproteobacteria bacterium]|nr:HNH endonuclease [Gammaproteobacteria bacterium]